MDVAERFDEVVSRMDTAMVVVTVAARGERDGCLVGFHCQCSIEPRRYAVWLSRANRTYELARGADHLAVHRLRASDLDLARLFGGTTGDDVDKFDGLEWTPGPGGVPLLDRCPDRFALSVVDRFDGDTDHLCFVGEPVAAEHSSMPAGPLRFSSAQDIDPGHEADERRIG